MDEQEEFFCGSCPYIAKGKKLLERHIYTVHLDIRNHPCPKCGKRFPFDCQLKKHISKIHEYTEEFECKTCGACCKQHFELVIVLSKIHGLLPPYIKKIEVKADVFLHQHL